MGVTFRNRGAWPQQRASKECAGRKALEGAQTLGLAVTVLLPVLPGWVPLAGHLLRRQSERLRCRPSWGLFSSRWAMACPAVPCRGAACCTPSGGVAKAKAVKGGRGLPRKVRGYSRARTVSGWGGGGGLSPLVAAGMGGRGGVRQGSRKSDSEPEQSELEESEAETESGSGKESSGLSFTGDTTSSMSTSTLSASSPFPFVCTL